MCDARTPSGALLAVMSLVLTLTVTPDTGARAQARDQAPRGQLHSNEYVNGETGYHETSYAAEITDPEGGPVTYAWTATGLECGTFTPSGGGSAVWSHPFGYKPVGCPNHGSYEGTGHAGVVEVVVTDRGGNQTRCSIEGSGTTRVACGSQEEPADCTLNLRLYDGQRGSTPADADEESRGALTVFNGNDTDADGGRDWRQDSVPDVMDLMKLRLFPPKPDNGGSVSLKVLAGGRKIAFYERPTKGVRLAHNPELTFPTSRLPLTLWVEGRRPSDQVRDVTLRYAYNPPGAAPACRDVADATIVWAEVGGVRDDRDEQVWADMPEPPQAAFDRTCHGLGLRPPAAKPRGMRNCIAFRFDVYPHSVRRLPGVEFDVSRQRESDFVVVATATGEELQRARSRFPPGDGANDDKRDNDESHAVDVDGQLFSFDGPGVPDRRSPHQIEVRARYDGRFREYVRVRFDGVRPTGNGVSGTVASPRVLWSARHTLLSNAQGLLERTTGDRRETDKNFVTRR